MKTQIITKHQFDNNLVENLQQQGVKLDNWDHMILLPLDHEGVMSKLVRECKWYRVKINDEVCACGVYGRISESN